MADIVNMHSWSFFNIEIWFILFARVGHVYV